MFSVLFLTIPLFCPPADWKIAQLKNPSPYIEVSFASTEGSQFRASMNLATEEVEVSLKEYVKAVKELRVKEPNTTWRDLGKFETKAGPGKLAEICVSSPHGDLKTLQAFFVYQKTAYILTATTLKSDFPKDQEKILQAFRSFSLEDSVSDALRDKKKQERLTALLAPLGKFASGEDVSLGRQKQWENLQREVVDSFAEMGEYWQFLALKEGLTKIQGN